MSFHFSHLVWVFCGNVFIILFFLLFFGNLRADFILGFWGFAPVLPPGLTCFLATFWAAADFMSFCVLGAYWAAEGGTVIPAAPLRFLSKPTLTSLPFYLGELYESL